MKRNTMLWARGLAFVALLLCSSCFIACSGANGNASPTRSSSDTGSCLIYPLTDTASFSINGATFTIATFAFVHVLNTQPVCSGNGQFAKGKVCSIQPGEQAGVVQVDSTGVLLQYVKSTIAYGALCPSGILFRVTSQALAQMKAAGEAYDQQKASNLALIHQLLIQKQTPAGFPARGTQATSIQWFLVTMMNPSPILLDHIATYDYGSTCPLEGGSIAQVDGADTKTGQILLGFVSGHVRECPESALTLVPVGQFSQMFTPSK